MIRTTESISQANFDSDDSTLSFNSEIIRNEATSEIFKLEQENVVLRIKIDIMKTSFLKMKTTHDRMMKIQAARIEVKKSFAEIKCYNQKFDFYFDHNHFKYDFYVYQMKNVFRNNEDLKNVKNSKIHKINFAIFYFEEAAFDVWKTIDRNNIEKKWTWIKLKVLFFKHVKKVKTLTTNFYIKWSQAEQKFIQSMTFYEIYLTFLKSNFSADMKSTEFVELINFKRKFRIEHRKKLFNLSKKKSLNEIIDQILDFEKVDSLDKSKNKRKRNDDHNVHDEKHQNENFNKRFRRDSENDDRDDKKNSSRKRDKKNKNNRDERNENRIENNFNHEFVANKVFQWFNNQSKNKQNEIRKTKACYCCDKINCRVFICKNNSENKFETKNSEKSKN